MKFNKRNVREWMEINISNCKNCTALAEAAASEFDQADCDGPLDDETHWI